MAMTHCCAWESAGDSGSVVRHPPTHPRRLRATAVCSCGRLVVVSAIVCRPQVQPPRAAHWPHGHPGWQARGRLCSGLGQRRHGGRARGVPLRLCVWAPGEGHCVEHPKTRVVWGLPPLPPLPRANPPLSLYSCCRVRTHAYLKLPLSRLMVPASGICVYVCVCECPLTCLLLCVWWALSSWRCRFRPCSPPSPVQRSTTWKPTLAWPPS